MHDDAIRTASTSSDELSADPSWRIGIVYSSYHPEIVSAMREAAVAELLHSGIHASRISHHPSPGSFEIPLIGRNLAESKSADALIALGVIVQGETHHAELIAAEAARGVMEVQLLYGIPFGFEILHVDDLKLAKERTVRGGEAARSVLRSLAAAHAIRESGY
jgi:6,7-dimethyl-8-ribityllumazine synthase